MLSAQKKSFLRHAVAELGKLSPQPGEDEELDTRRRMMQGAEKIRDDVIKALEALGQDGAESRMGNALRWLDGVADKAEGHLEAPISSLGRAMVELDEAMDGIVSCIDTLSFNPSDLEDTEERLFAIRAIARKYDVAPDDSGGSWPRRSVRKLAALDAGDADLADLRAALKTEAEAGYDDAATALTNARRKSAGKLDKAVTAELAPSENGPRSL